MLRRSGVYDFCMARPPSATYNPTGLTFGCVFTLCTANVLLLRGSITLRKGTTDVSRTELLTLVTTRLLEANEKAQVIT
jgi:hypothetical protein